MPSTKTPLRFPGGKTKLYNYVTKSMWEQSPKCTTYIEPFAGGAGIAMKLLLGKEVEHIIINDIDRSIYSIWKLILSDNDELASFIQSVPLTIDEWRKQKEIVTHKTDYDDCELGLASFFMNRTNVSGIISGGPIGGTRQNGKYKIDARFNRDGLLRKIKEIKKEKSRVRLYNMDAAKLIETVIKKIDASSSFVYFDPPYVNKGPLLYENSYKKEDHENLAAQIQKLNRPWLVTYDDCEFIRNLYRNQAIEQIEISYSAGKTRKGSEVAIKRHKE